MKLMLVHLSDIHITSEDNTIIRQFPYIVDAVKNLDYELDMCVVTVTGDIAYSGQEEQYLIAMEALEKTKDNLSRSLSQGSHDPLPVHVVVLPGNHDCDFLISGDLRELILPTVLTDHTKATSTEVVDLCTAVQQRFFQFREAVESVSFEPASPNYDHRLAYQYKLACGDASVLFLCYNTAWLSQLHESQGRLYFPAEAVVLDQAECELVVAAFHHPYNWIESNSARSFRQRVETVADVILTGHEHVPSRRAQEGDHNQNNIYVEGGVLQDTNAPDISEFNVFIFDTVQQQYKFASFSWDGHKYSLADGSILGGESGGLGWKTYQENQARPSRRFRLSEEMKHILDDPGISLIHGRKGNLGLSDVFLYPELLQMRTRDEIFGQRISGNEIIDTLDSQSLIMITGDTESGKTCFAKTLFKDISDIGVTPVFIDGTRRLPTGDSIYGHIEGLFAEQFNKQQLEEYRQLDVSLRAIIIDDFDKLDLSPSQKKNLLNKLALHANNVIIFANDISSDLSDLTNPGHFRSTLGDVQRYRIQPMGFVSRNKLVERWMLLESGSDSSDLRFVQNLTRRNETINTIVGRNYVPSYPVYILAVLQALDAATHIEMNASTHGYFYELFIRTSLARGRSNIDFDIIASYLAYVARQFQLLGVKVIEESAFRSIHDDFQDRYDIRRSYESIKQQLLNQNILVAVNGGIAFRYSYLYNYFVASYLKDHIFESGVQETIARMSREVHIETNANILLFLAHLCKDPTVIAELLEASRARFPQRSPITLDADIRFLDSLGPTLPDVVYEERDTRANREAVLAKIDQVNPPDDGTIDFASDESESDVDADNPVVQIYAAVRHLDILGQILKNFPGSLEGSVKLDIARECYQLGLRSLSAIFDIIESDQAEILRQIAQIVKENNPRFTTLETENRARETLVEMSQVLTYGMILRVSRAVGSRDLFKTFEKLMKESDSAAYKLINCALEIDNRQDFPEGPIRTAVREFEDDPLPLSVLRHLVVSHFQLYPVGYITKKRMCDIMDISYSKLYRSTPVPKMIPAGRTRPRPN